MLPVLYSFRRCPYAIRARMAIRYSNVTVELREVDLKNKPQQLLSCSAKATVPVLQLDDNTVIDESLDIMMWALAQSDPDNWLTDTGNSDTRLTNKQIDLVDKNDGEFKTSLDKYKYADRHDIQQTGYYRQQCETFLIELDALLAKNTYLNGSHVTLTDVAVFPFIRQFANVDKEWFAQCPYARLRQWLNQLLLSPLFTSTMKKYPVWQPGDIKQTF